MSEETTAALAACCDSPDLGPMTTGGDGDVIATAQRCCRCGVLHMDFLTTQAATSDWAGDERV